MQAGAGEVVEVGGLQGVGVRVKAEAVAALLIGDDKENVGLVFKHGHSS